MANIQFVRQQQCAIFMGEAVVIFPLPTCLLHSENWRNLLRKVYLWTWRFKLVRRCMQKLLEHRMWMKKFRWVKKIKKIKNLGFLPAVSPKFLSCTLSPSLGICVLCVKSMEWVEWHHSSTEKAAERAQHSTAQQSLEFDVLCYALSFSNWSAGSFPSKEGINKLWRTLNVDNI